MPYAHAVYRVAVRRTSGFVLNSRTPLSNVLQLGRSTCLWFDSCGSRWHERTRTIRQRTEIVLVTRNDDVRRSTDIMRFRGKTLLNSGDGGGIPAISTCFHPSRPARTSYLPRTQSLYYIIIYSVFCRNKKLLVQPIWSCRRSTFVFEKKNIPKTRRSVRDFGVSSYTES